MARRLLPVVVVITTCFMPLMVVAQPIWTDQTHTHSLTLEAMKLFKGDREVSFAASTWFLNYHGHLSQGLAIEADVPWSYFDTDFQGFDSQSKFGNPYIGVEILLPTAVFFDIGVRLPFVSSANFASVFAQGTDPERFEAFAPDALTLIGVVNFLGQADSGFFFRLRGGPYVMISTGDGGPTLGIPLQEQGNSHLYLAYGGIIGYDQSGYNLSGGLTARTNVTGSGDFGNRSFLQLGLNGRARLGRWLPGVHVMIPLEDDVKEVVDWVLGLNVGYIID